ncbi:MAG: DNA polymerase III subunit delta' [Thermodesulfobacteriota bacterium]
MSFEDITGHAREKEILEKAISAGRVAHSYLFTGPEGIGKRSLAREFAGALNCAGSGAPCGACEDCRLVRSATHPNLIEVWPEDKDGVRTVAGLIRIARVRELQDAIKYKSTGGKKVVIVDGADKMEQRAANALLKTLEEPPPDSVIILISSKPGSLLSTIISRCQRIIFRPLPEELVREFLVKSNMAAPDDAGRIARLSAGSIASAVKYSEDGVFEKRREIVERLSGLDGDDTAGLFAFAGELSARGDLGEVLEFLKLWCRDVMVFSEGAGELMVNADLEGFIKAAPAPKALADSFDMIEKARYDVTPPRYANKLLAMEALLMGLAGKGALI